MNFDSKMGNNPSGKWAGVFDNENIISYRKIPSADFGKKMLNLSFGYVAIRMPLFPMCEDN